MTANPIVKVNLGLDVIRKRNDGFHDLETVFLPYSGISDTLEIIRADEYSTTVSHISSEYSVDRGQIVQALSPDGRLMITIARREGVDWNPLEDLTAKAYFLLAEEHGLGPVKIFLEKKSPVGAGLGGGSSDAASAIVLLDRLFALGLDEQEMAACAARLGSDCAFFIYGRPMFGQGRGDILSDYELPSGFYDDYELKVVVPEGISVSTADAYRGIRPAVPEIPLRTRLSGNVETWKDCIRNDFEETVFAKYPVLAEVKRSLYDSGAVYASMSGSGSAFFAVYRK